MAQALPLVAGMTDARSPGTCIAIEISLPLRAHVPACPSVGWHWRRMSRIEHLLAAMLALVQLPFSPWVPGVKVKMLWITGAALPSQLVLGFCKSSTALVYPQGTTSKLANC